jgi:hypothetical protein
MKYTPLQQSIHNKIVDNLSYYGYLCGILQEFVFLWLKKGIIKFLIAVKNWGFTHDCAKE